jgi:hypothetical protein
MAGFPVSEFLVLLGLGLFGGLAIIPYLFSLNRDKMAQAKLPLPVLALIGFLQTALLTALAVGVGLLAAQPIGLGAPLIRAALAGQPVWDSFLSWLPLAVGLGILSAALLILLERLVFAPHVPEALRSSDVKTSAWKRWLACFYGSLNEEILMRLLLVSGLAWVLSRFWQNASGQPAKGAYWTAILLAAVLFGLGHLPATKALTQLTPLIVTRALVLNGIVGIATGWLYWQYGLEAAMLTHFSADIMIHLIAPLFAGHIYNHTPTGEALPESN